MAELGHGLQGNGVARTCLVLGGAKCLWDDISTVFDMMTPEGTIAVNDAIAHYAQPLTMAVTLHHEKMPAWREQRARNGFAPALEHIGHEMAPGIDRAIDYRFPGMTGSGSSGLFAVKAAIEAGFDRIVLAGVPMDPKQAHFFDAKQWHEFMSFLPGWENAMPHIRHRVRSVSGWTKKMLGEPTSAWLNG